MDRKRETMVQAIAAARKMHLLAEDTRVSHLVGVIPRRYLSPNDFPTPQEGVAIPDAAVQIIKCLSDDERAGLMGVLRDRFGTTADIRGGCIGRQERIGIWLHPTADATEDAARTAGVSQLDIASAGVFAFYIGSALVLSQAQTAFAAKPKVLGTNGQPLQGGPINLTAIETRLVDPDKVETRVAGYDTEVWPSLNFHIVITDTLFATGGSLQCSSQTKLEKDTGGFWALAAFFPLPFLPEAIGVELAGPPTDLGGGAGCIIKGLLPRQILTSNGKTIVNYESVEISEIGIVVQGSFIPDVARDPTVQIVGQTSFWVRKYLNEHSVKATYVVSTADLGEKLAVTWTVNGIAQQGQSAITLELSLPKKADDKGQYVHKIGVHVTDEDNYSADAEIEAVLKVLSTRPPPPPGKIILRPKSAS